MNSYIQSLKDLRFFLEPYKDGYVDLEILRRYNGLISKIQLELNINLEDYIIKSHRIENNKVHCSWIILKLDELITRK